MYISKTLVDLRELNTFVQAIGSSKCIKEFFTYIIFLGYTSWYFTRLEKLYLLIYLYIQIIIIAINI